MTENFAMIVGEEELTVQLDCGLIFTHRPPTAKEIVNYKNSLSFHKKGKAFSTKSAEQQLRLANDIIIDVKNLGYRNADGETEALGKHTRPEDIAHLKVDGAAPRSWKDLVPALQKIQFIEILLAGVEGEEKNV